MVRKLDETDFRRTRSVLEPDDFGLRDNLPDDTPTDLIGEEAWHGIMDLPDDVAVRTTSHQGSHVVVLHELTSAWVKALPDDPAELISYAMLDGFDSLQAATYTLIHGFYKEAIAALRSALEVMTFAVSCQLANDTETWERWLVGDELSFKRQCDRLQKIPKVERFEQVAIEQAGLGLFKDLRGSGRDCWARDLYHRQSEYVHARGANSSLWQSNGPIYSERGFALAYHSFLETFSLIFLLAKLAEPELLPGKAGFIFDESNRAKYLSSLHNKICGSYVMQLL